MITNRKLKLSSFFMGFVLLALPYISHTEDTEETLSTQAAEILISQKDINNLLMQVNTKCTTIERLILDIKTIIEKQNKSSNSTAIKSLHTMAINFKPTIENIFKELEVYAQNKTTNTTILLSTLKKAINFCDQTLQHIETAIACNFKTLPSKDYFVMTTTRSNYTVSDSIELKDALTTQLKNLESTITNIQKKSNFIGLKWYQKGSRLIRDNVWNPCKKWNLHRYIPAASLTALFCAYTWWQFYSPNSATFKDQRLKGVDFNDHLNTYNSVTQFLIKKLGPAHGWNNGGIPYFFDDAHKGTINTTVATAITYLKNIDPIAAMGGGYLLSKAKSEYDLKWSPYLSQKWENFCNKTLGGAYEERHINGNYQLDPKHTLDNIIGLEDAKKQIQDVLAYALNPAPCVNRGKIPTCNFLFTGATRSGKTYFARGFAGTLIQQSPLNFKMFEIPIFTAMEYGVQTLIEYVKDLAPCVLFIDEGDLGGLQRGSNRQLLYDFLTALGRGETISDDPYKPVILIVASNKLEAIDESLRTKKRFGIDVRFEYPKLHERAQFIMQSLSHVVPDAQAFDIVKLAKKTANQSFENIEHCITHALNTSIVRAIPLTQEVLEEAINEEIFGLSNTPPHHLDEDSIKLLSAHFAGRALALELLDCTRILDTVSINKFSPHVSEDIREAHEGRQGWQKKSDYGLIIERGVADNLNLLSFEKSKNHIKQLVAGSVAEEILFGGTNNMCHPENNFKAFTHAQTIVSGGIWKNDMSEVMRNKKCDEACDLLETCKKEIKELLLEHKEALESIAHVLSFFGTLNDTNIRVIIENPSLGYQFVDQFKKAIQKQQQDEPSNTENHTEEATA